jgi:hypothetical protein
VVAENASQSFEDPKHLITPQQEENIEKHQILLELFYVFSKKIICPQLITPALNQKKIRFSR